MVELEEVSGEQIMWCLWSIFLLGATPAFRTESMASIPPTASAGAQKWKTKDARSKQKKNCALETQGAAEQQC